MLATSGLRLGAPGLPSSSHPFPNHNPAAPCGKDPAAGLTSLPPPGALPARSKIGAHLPLRKVLPQAHTSLFALLHHSNIY